MRSQVMFQPRIAAVAIATLLCAPALRAQDRVRLIVNGGFNPTTSDFSETRSFTEFVETATVKADYKTKSAFSPDVGVQVQLFNKLGAFVAYASTKRDETGSFDARLPHPLYLNRPRSLAGDLSGYRYQEQAVHLDLAYGAGQGHLDYALFAGVSRFSVKADLLDSVHYSHSYPYDSVTFGSAPAKSVKDTPLGFNAGGRLDYRFGQSRRFGLGALLRFSRATAKLKATDASTLEVDSGGLQAGIGARLYF
jgi:hypothetical protein